MPFASPPDDIPLLSHTWCHDVQGSIDLLVGDVFLSAACIAYYGAFPGDFRQELLSGWVEKCKLLGIPVSPDCTLRGVLASPIQVSCHSTILLTLLHSIAPQHSSESIQHLRV